MAAADICAVIGGALLGVGLAVFVTDVIGRYMVSHGVHVALFHGIWPTDAAKRRKMNRALGDADARALRAYRRLWPLGGVAFAAGIVVIVLGQVLA